MRIGALLYCLAFLVGCDGAKLTHADVSIRLAPDRLEFGDVPRGKRVITAARLANRGRAAARVKLVAENALVPTEVDLSGGEEVELPVAFSSIDLGEHTGSVTATWEGGTQTVSFSARVVPADACPSSPCREPAFDSETNTCIEVPGNEGSSCVPEQGLCARQGVCESGACIPTASGCDDGNACTRDSCDATGACISIPAGEACAAISNPCAVGACDPLEGCIEVPANDGIRCGPNDCTGNHVCRAGACVVEPVVEGQACGAASPCQDIGQCIAGNCVRPPATALKLRWEQQVGLYDWNLGLISGVVDRNGNLYRVDDGILQSWSPQGLVRFSQLLMFEGARRVARLMVYDAGPEERVLVLYENPPKIELRSVEDGALLRSIDLQPLASELVQPSTQVPPATSWYTFATAIAHGRTAYVALSFVSASQHGTEDEQRGAAIAAIDLEEGIVTWSAPDVFAFKWLDTDANLYTYSFGDTEEVHLRSHTPDGAERFHQVAPIAAWIPAVFADRVYLGSVFGTDGSFIRKNLITEGVLERDLRVGPYLTRRSLWITGYGTSSSALQLVRAHPQTGDVLWSRPMPDVPDWNQLSRTLIGAGEQFIAHGMRPDDTGTWGDVLVGFDEFGDSWSCELPRTDGNTYVIGFADNTLYVINRYDVARVRAYDVPGISPERDGWTHHNGTEGEAMSVAW